MEKVLFKIRGLEFGGIERLVVDIVNNLDLREKEVVLLTENKENFFKEQLLKNVEIVYIRPDNIVKYFEYFQKKESKIYFIECYIIFLKDIKSINFLKI